MTIQASSMNAHKTIRSAAAVAAALIHVLLRAAPAAAQDTLAQAAGATPGGPRFTVISAGAAHTCGLTAEGAAYCWGRNEYGQLGDSTTGDRATPVAVGRGREFREISAGDGHTCAISVDNEVFCWGRNDGGSIGTGPQQRAYPVKVIGNMRSATISAGSMYTCSVDVRGVGFCWGHNKHGQLGPGGNDNAYTPQSPFGVRTYRVIVAGTRHTCGITVGNRVLCWGANERGQLGNASRTPSAVPFQIRFFDTKTGFAAVALGTDHTCALDLSGAAFCWGDNSAGQLGIGSTKKKMSVVPVLVPGGLSFTSLVAAGQTTCATTQAGAGEVYCWGSNAEGQFGGGPTEGSATPVRAAEAFAPVAISLGAGRACGLTRDGTASCWGRGTSAESGAAPADR